MNKLASIIKYECITSSKYIGIFYAIQYAVILLIGIVLTSSNVGALEVNTLVYVGILGVLGFKEDFKMLMQHGFTRKYIYIGALSLFAYVSAILAFIDTVAGNILHLTIDRYNSLYGSIYGYDNVIFNFLWLFMLYMLVCSIAYLVVLAINNLGKTKSLYLGVVIVFAIIFIVTLFKSTLLSEFALNLSVFFTRAFGFMANGSINYLLPIITLFISTVIFSIGSYLIIKKTELK